MWWRLGIPCLLVMSALVSCSMQDQEPLTVFSAERLGPQIPETSLAAQLSPAQRDALADQGYEIGLDDDDWDVQAAEEAAARGEQAEEAEKGGFKRTMDHIGRATVAVTMVAVSVGMMIAPFFLM